MVDFTGDWNAFEMQIESLVARAANAGWALRRGDLVDTKAGSCCLLGAIVLAQWSRSSHPPCFEDAVEIIGDATIASALEGGFEGWESMEDRAPRAFEIGRRICRRYGADPMHASQP
jgi:hypothetical protein